MGIIKALGMSVMAPTSEVSASDQNSISNNFCLTLT